MLSFQQKKHLVCAYMSQTVMYGVQRILGLQRLAEERKRPLSNKRNIWFVFIYMVQCTIALKIVSRDQHRPFFISSKRGLTCSCLQTKR